MSDRMLQRLIAIFALGVLTSTIMALGPAAMWQTLSHML